MQVIENPPIPFSVPIHNGFPYNGEIEVEGKPIFGQEKGFVVELRAGNDLALHISVRFGQSGETAIVLNSQQWGKWEKEERFKNKLVVGDPFRLQIVNHEKHFLIHLNGQNLCHFKHRIPASSIALLKILGDLSVSKVLFRGFTEASPTPTRNAAPSQGPRMNAPYQQNPPYPYPQPVIGSGAGPSMPPAYIQPAIGSGASPSMSGAMPPPPYSAYPTAMPMAYAPPPPVVVASSHVPPPVVYVDQDCHYRHHYDYHCEPHYSHHHHHGLLHGLFHHRGHHHHHHC